MAVPRLEAVRGKVDNSTATSLKPTKAGEIPVKDRLIDKLVEENRNLLAASEAFREKDVSERAKIRRDAGLIMERLVQDNAYYRRENETLNSRLASGDEQNSKFRNQLSELLKERHHFAEEKRLLERYSDSLRESKCDLEYQCRHLGAAFLTLRDASLDFIAHPVALEAQLDDTSWESRASTPQFQKAVIETVQMTERLRATVEAIDQRLVGLRLLDVSAAMKRNLPRGPNGPLQLMGERLVPEKDLLQIRKERQMWQTRYMKSQEDVAKGKAELEQLTKTVEHKELLLKRAIAQKGIHRPTEQLRSSLRAHNLKLQEEIKRLTDTLSDSQRQLGILRKQKRQEKEKIFLTPVPPVPVSDARSAVSRTPSVSPLRPQEASQFLGTSSALSRRDVSAVTPRREPSRHSENILVSKRTMLSPKASARGSLESIPAFGATRRDSDIVSVKSRTVRTPSKSSPPPLPSHLIAPTTELPPPPKLDSRRSSSSIFGAKRTIGTTITKSPSELASEVSALEKLRSAEDIRETSRTIRTPSKSSAPSKTPRSPRPPLPSHLITPPSTTEIPARSLPPLSSRGSLRSSISLLGAKRTIGTTITKSPYQSELAREVSALEKLCSAEDKQETSRVATTFLGPSKDTVKPVKLIGQSSLSAPVSPSSVSVISAPVVTGTVPLSSLTTSPLDSTMGHMGQHATEGTEAIATTKPRPSPMAFLGPPPPTELKHSEGRVIGRRGKSSELRDRPPSMSVLDVESQRTRSRQISIGRRSVSPTKRDTELDTNIGRSFFASPDTEHQASAPFTVSSQTSFSDSPRLPPLTVSSQTSFSDSPRLPPLTVSSQTSFSDSPRLQPCPKSFTLASSFSSAPSDYDAFPVSNKTIGSFPSAATLSDIVSEVYSVLDLKNVHPADASTTDCPFYHDSHRTARRIHSSDLSSLLTILDRIPNRENRSS